MRRIDEATVLMCVRVWYDMAVLRGICSMAASGLGTYQKKVVGMVNLGDRMVAHIG